MFEEINKRKILIIGLICTILIIGGILYYFLQKENKDEYLDCENIYEENNEIDNEITNEVVEQKEKIVIHILGQVVNEGVISLDEGSRVIDAINMAGGTTGQADLSKINLAYVLEDAEKIYIPSINDNEQQYILEQSGDTGNINTKSKNTSNKEGKIMININTATQEELQKLQGIGEAIALRIIEYRKQNGKFNTIEEIKNVSGIGDSKFNKIKNNIFVK